jgi:hypothetical protein
LASRTQATPVKNPLGIRTIFSLRSNNERRNLIETDVQKTGKDVAYWVPLSLSAKKSFIF